MELPPMDCCDEFADYNACVREKNLFSEEWFSPLQAPIPQSGEVMVYVKDGKALLWKYVIDEEEWE